MSRSVRLVLLSLSAFLLIFPLTVGKPGMPASLKADESAYYLMALSLAHDFDLQLEVRDVDRLFHEYPFSPTNNLILMSDDGWRTVYFGKPYVYSLFAAPFARLFGANGLVFCNMLMLVAMIWMGAHYLRRFNDSATAAAFAIGFFLLSAAVPYVFWLQPELFNMFAVAACLYWGLPRPRRLDSLEETASWGAAAFEGDTRRSLLLAAASGAVLSLSLYNKPMLAAVGLAPLCAYALRRRWKAIAAWGAGSVVALATVAGLAVALTGHPTSYLGVTRQGVTVCEPGKLPIQPLAPAAASPATPGEPPAAAPAAAPNSKTGNAWSWLIRNPGITWGELAENLGYFLWGRHTGMLLYLPFAALAVLLFLFHNRHWATGWVLLASLFAVGLFFVVFIAWNWQGGGGFIGNRYFINVYPGFLFLVSRIRPRWTIALGSAWAGLCLGPLLATPFGAGGPEPTLQSHVRSFPYPYLPYELSLKNVPGYEKIAVGSLRIQGRKDQFLPQGEPLWLRGADRVELHLISDRPLDRAVFRVESGAPGNRIELRMQHARETLRFARQGEARRVELAPGEPYKVRTQRGQTFWIYRLLVSTATGRTHTWTRYYPPPSCPTFGWNASTQESFFLGASLTYLGNGAGLDADLYRIQWGNVVAPPAVRAGSAFPVITRLFNRSAVTWEAQGAARVKLAYHWRDAAGTEVLREGERTAIDLPVAPGGRVSVRQKVVAPAKPGRYLLELDPVFETVSWFSARNGGKVYRIEIEVTP